jgi:polyisoprenyl-phosphate glycosyltransferase
LTEPRVSVAIALYNEEEVLPELLARLTAVLDDLPGGPHEMVLVDDGSSDRTWERLSSAAAADPRIVGISLSRNFGHQAALSAALDNITGDVVIVMDGDLQDRPEEIPRFLEGYTEGFDVVYATRVGRQERWLLRACYFLFYRLMALVADLRMPLDSGDFALLSRRVVDRINALPERNRYLRGLRTWIGFQQTGIPVKRDARAAGKPAYTVGKLIKLALDGLFAFSVAPLRAAAVIGGFATAGASVFAAYSIFIRVFLGQSPQGFTALIVAITFFSGVQLMFLGLIGEYVGRVYDEAKGRPHYVVSTVVGNRGAATQAELEIAFRREPNRLERIG